MKNSYSEKSVEKSELFYFSCMVKSKMLEHTNNHLSHALISFLPIFGLLFLKNSDISAKTRVSVDTASII